MLIHVSVHVPTMFLCCFAFVSISVRLRCAATLCIQQMASAPDGICVRRQALQKPWKFLGSLNAPPWMPPGGAPGRGRASSKTFKNHWKINKILLPANHVPAERPKAPPRDRLQNLWNPLKNLAKTIGSVEIRPVPGVRPAAARAGDREGAGPPQKPVKAFKKAFESFKNL